MDKEDATKLQESVDMIAKTTAHILENMATKQELFATRKDISNLQTQVNGIETDLKSFKNETREEFKKVNTKLDDLAETHTNFDTRIEKLEEKLFA